MHNILIVDDVKYNIKLFKEKIAKEISATFYTASNLPNAMQILYSHPIDIALLDVNLKNYSGYDIAIEMSKDPHLRMIPIIFITATETTEKKILHGYSSGAIDYLIKPINSIILNQKIKNLLALFDINTKLKKELISHEIATNNLKTQLNLCHKFQLYLLPKDYNDSYFKIKSFHKTFDYTGGDMFFYQKIQPNKYFVILLDVMGHSIYTSILAIYIRSQLNYIVKKENNLNFIVKKINSLIFEFNETLKKNNFQDLNFFITSVALIIDTNLRKIDYVNSGHLPFFIINQNKKIKNISSNSLPLGIISNPNIKYNTLFYKNKIDVLLYTDGVQFLDNISEDKQIELLKKVINSNNNLFDELKSKILKSEITDDTSLLNIIIGEKNE